MGSEIVKTFIIVKKERKEKKRIFKIGESVKIKHKNLLFRPRLRRRSGECKVMSSFLNFIVVDIVTLVKQKVSNPSFML